MKFSSFIKQKKLNKNKHQINFKKPLSYIIPIDPAVNPTTKKKVNSSKSLGNELTIKFN